MKFYNRNGMLYISISGKRVSTKLQDTPKNRVLFANTVNEDEFFDKFNVNKKENIPSILELCEEVLQEKEKILKGTSLLAYNSCYTNKVIPFFKNIKLKQLKPKDIFDWYKTFSGSSSIKTSEAILKEAIEKALIAEYIQASPFVIKKPKFLSTYEMKPFSLDEIMKILNSKAEKSFLNFLGVLFFTGMRIGEALGLQWQDIDFENDEISINRTITSGLIQSPKTPSSKRVIDLLPQARLFLEKQKRINGLCKYVIINKKTKQHYNTSSTLRLTWKSLSKQLNMEYRNIYQTRHSFASNMLNNGEELLWVSSMLGHKTADITLKKYSKFIKDKRIRRAIFLDKMDLSIS